MKWKQRWTGCCLQKVIYVTLSKLYEVYKFTSPTPTVQMNHAKFIDNAVVYRLRRWQFSLQTTAKNSARQPDLTAAILYNVVSTLFKSNARYWNSAVKPNATPCTKLILCRDGSKTKFRQHSTNETIILSTTAKIPPMSGKTTSYRCNCCK